MTLPVFSFLYSSDDMIEFKNISKHYVLKGQTLRALDQINLEIPAGSIFGIIGYSGAGKSTLIRLINLLERQPKGRLLSIKLISRLWMHVHYVRNVQILA